MILFLLGVTTGAGFVLAVMIIQSYLLDRHQSTRRRWRS